jgi:hypothetical protein
VDDRVGPDVARRPVADPIGGGERLTLLRTPAVGVVAEAQDGRAIVLGLDHEARAVAGRVEQVARRQPARRLVLAQALEQDRGPDVAQRVRERSGGRRRSVEGSGLRDRRLGECRPEAGGRRAEVLRPREPVVDEHDVPARHAHVVDRDIALLGARRQDEIERQRVLWIPFDLGDRRAVERVGERVAVGLVDDPHQAHGVAVRRVAVGAVAGARPLDLLEHQHGAGGEVRMRPGQRRRGGAGWERAAVVPPRIEAQLVEIGEQRRRRHDRLEPLGRRVQRGTMAGTAGRHARAEAGHLGEERQAVRVQDHVGVDRELQPRARVAAVVHRIVHEQRVPARGDPPPAGPQVRLRRDRVLAVAQVVADVGEQLDQRDADVGRAALLPVGRQQRHPVEDQPPEARVVLREIVDLGPAGGRRRLAGRRPAVEVGRAVDLEREGDLREHRIEARRRPRVRARARERERVAREVAGRRRPQDDRVRLDRQHVDLDVADALAAADLDVVGAEASLLLGRQRVHEVDGQAPLPEQLRPAVGRQRVVLGELARVELAGHEVADLQVVDGVERRVALHGGSPLPVGARVLHCAHAWPACSKRSTRCSPVTCTTYCTSTLSFASSRSISTRSIATTSPSHCCSAPCTSAWVAVASSSDSGANVSCSSPLPKSGRFTRSPGTVNSTCSMRSRTWSSRPVVAVRPRPSK